MTEAKHHQVKIVDEGYKGRGYRNENGTNSLSGAPTKLSVQEVYDDEGNFVKYKLVSSKVKFDDEAREIFLTQLATHGRLGTAARAAGVTITTARRHVSQDPEFAEMMAEAIEVYKDRLINHHQNLVFNGTQKETYDRNGQLVSRETVYPVRLIELELKKHDAGYRDKQEISHEHKGGVVVAPGAMSADEWEERFSNRKPPIGDVEDAEVVDVTDDERED